VPREQKKLPAKLGQIYFLRREKLVSQGQLVYVPDKLFTKRDLAFPCFWISWLTDGYLVPGVLSYV